MAGMDRDAILAQVRLVSLIDTADVSDAEIVLLINSGMDEIGVAGFWPFLEASTTVTAVASQQNYDLPADFEFAVALVDDDNDQTVPYIAPTTFFNNYGNDTGNESDTASFWTIWNEDIYFHPIPSANDTDRWTLYYYKTITQLAAGASVPEFHEAFHQMLVDYVMWKLYTRHEYFQESQRAASTYAIYMMAMRDWYSRRTKRQPGIVGDGRFQENYGDPNIPSLWRI